MQPAQEEEYFSVEDLYKAKILKPLTTQNSIEEAFSWSRTVIKHLITSKSCLQTYDWIIEGLRLIGKNVRRKTFDQFIDLEPFKPIPKQIYEKMVSSECFGFGMSTGKTQKQLDKKIAKFWFLKEGKEKKLFDNQDSFQTHYFTFYKHKLGYYFVAHSYQLLFSLQDWMKNEEFFEKWYKQLSKSQLYKPYMYPQQLLIQAAKDVILPSTFCEEHHPVCQNNPCICPKLKKQQKQKFFASLVQLSRIQDYFYIQKDVET